MTTDIHALDQYIGNYVDISEGEHGAAGFLVNVSDNVNYNDGDAFRWVTLDWGHGWPIRATTRITMAQPPAKEAAPITENPVQIIHQQMDGHPCSDPDCPNRTRALKVMRALRAWQARQNDQHWIHHYLDKLKSLLDDPVSVGDLLREARSEGAPPHILDRMQSLVDQNKKLHDQGWS